MARLVGSSQGLFSPDQIQRLMRIEFDRAQRYGYPIVFMLVAVDRLAQLQDLHGYAIKERILRGLTSLLKTATRASDFLGCTVDDRLLILIPHTPPEGAAVVARRILEGSRRLRFDCEGRQVRASASIGGAHNQRGRDIRFETLLEVAEGGLAVAQAGGGDRYVHSELYEFFERKRAREGPPGAEPAAAVAAGPGEIGMGLLGDKIRELFGLGDADGPLLARIERAVIAQALKEMQDELDTALSASRSEHQRQIDLLERRIAKLTHVLGLNEDEMARLRSAKSVDPGIASIYTSVQGLSPDEVNAELKRALMSKIFEANLELRRQLGSGG